ncbi:MULTISPECIES: carbon-nitrogen hydrolase family protein [Paracoccus]|uniref:Carbon-nitrogen hydrolase family protein n=2 Tax=Paracoccus TaxID=265 RepID=A0A5C4R5T3_9RHOB|nr:MULTISPECIES: carbon-nitrogen hydrolase family protein [Paracoccus]AZY92477.1 amidohydrolase [Paracoccus sp. Arc7-R13]TNC02290.1 carbon-nitrogen hydrolase family protein [Paracoccus marcusii]TNH39340.1 carbon-nitrogen hydrolase family protein [Paracoccus haeundaensis]WDA13395.1 carbon-nitrogen hydrolase family protein [Paracoccus marcusii]
MKIAAAAYPIDWFDSFDAYAAKLARWVSDADADLLVFPEYGAMELASLSGRAVAGDLEASLHAVAALDPQVRALHADLAARHGCHILGASGPAFDGARPVNRAVLYGPDGVIGHQDKQIMTRFEREEWHVTGAPGLRIFDTTLGRIGILICYDSEFPLLGRVLAQAGAQLLLVPSCTDTVAGFSRVRIGAMARALESQCVVVQAPTVGPCDWMPALDENRGRAAIYGPPDGFWPETGIIAEGEMDAPGWVRATVDLSRVDVSRRDGAVLPFAHWPEQEPCRLI